MFNVMNNKRQGLSSMAVLPTAASYSCLGPTPGVRKQNPWGWGQSEWQDFPCFVLHKLRKGTSPFSKSQICLFEAQGAKGDVEKFGRKRVVAFTIFLQPVTQRTGTHWRFTWRDSVLTPRHRRLPSPHHGTAVPPCITAPRSGMTSAASCQKS